MRAESGQSEERWLVSALIFPSALAIFPALNSILDIIHPETLEVYKKAFAANQKIYRFLKGNKSIPAYAKDQLGRASLSIMLNIAEGSAKFSNKDRRNFYVTARGSVFECAALATFLHDEGEISIDVFQEVSSAYEELSRMLYAMIKNLEE